MVYGKKELRAVVAPMGNHYVLEFKEGGELPKEFQGMFTSPTLAIKHAEGLVRQGRTPLSKKD